MVCEVVEKEEPKIVAEDIIQDIIKQAILRVEKKLNKIPPQVQTEVEVFKIQQELQPEPEIIYSNTFYSLLLLREYFLVHL